MEALKEAFKTVSTLSFGQDNPSTPKATPWHGRINRMSLLLNHVDHVIMSKKQEVEIIITKVLKFYCVAQYIHHYVGGCEVTSGSNVSSTGVAADILRSTVYPSRMGGMDFFQNAVSSRLF